MNAFRLCAVGLLALGLGVAVVVLVDNSLHEGGTRSENASPVPAPVAATTRPAPARAAQPRGGPPRQVVLNLGADVAMRLVRVPAGRFKMGSPRSEPQRDADETPHPVRISRPFYIGATEVTQGQYAAVTGKRPSHFRGDFRPVEFVSWLDAAAFCEALSDLLDRRVRLPTEAEWEYAARAGTRTAYFMGDVLPLDEATFDDAAVDGAISEQAIQRGTTDIADYPANAWGVHDMHGNLWEWCADWYAPYAPGEQVDPTGPTTGQVRVLRGGSWHQPSRLARSANRYWARPTLRHYNVGFRIVLEADAPAPRDDSR
jgi:formylglycine-generating enzyme required for sulfatase activity